MSICHKNIIFPSFEAGNCASNSSFKWMKNTHKQCRSARVKKWGMKVRTLTSADLHSSYDDDDDQGQYFGHCEDALHTRRPFHIPAIDNSQQCCEKKHPHIRWEKCTTYQSIIS